MNCIDEYELFDMAVGVVCKQMIVWGPTKKLERAHHRKEEATRG